MEKKKEDESDTEHDVDALPKDSGPRGRGPPFPTRESKIDSYDFCKLPAHVDPERVSSARQGCCAVAQGESSWGSCNIDFPLRMHGCRGLSWRSSNPSRQTHCFRCTREWTLPLAPPAVENFAQGCVTHAKWGAVLSCCMSRVPVKWGAGLSCCMSRVPVPVLCRNT